MTGDIRDEIWNVLQGYVEHRSDMNTVVESIRVALLSDVPEVEVREAGTTVSLAGTRTHYMMMPPLDYVDGVEPGTYKLVKLAPPDTGRERPDDK